VFHLELALDLDPLSSVLVRIVPFELPFQLCFYYLLSLSYPLSSVIVQIGRRWAAIRARVFLEGFGCQLESALGLRSTKVFFHAVYKASEAYLIGFIKMT